MIVKIPESLDHAVSNLTESPTRNIGITLGDIWYLAMGGISQAAEKKRIKYANDLEIFKNELESEAAKIPPEKATPPDYQTVGPALERAKYCADKNEIRSMFVKLIASTMNADLQQKAHPAFPEIISQMTPIDASNLLLYKAENQYPIVEYHFVYENTKYSIAQTNYFLANPKIDNYLVQASSLSNLSRLGLIRITYDEYSSNANDYAQFSETPYMKMCKGKIGLPADNELPHSQNNLLTTNVDFYKGLAIITPLGYDFIQCCL